MSQIFSVSQIFELDQAQILAILKAFNWVPQNLSADKLSATILLLNNGNIVDYDIPIVSHPEFSRLYLLDIDSLKLEASSRGAYISSSPPDIIRNIIKLISPELFPPNSPTLAPQPLRYESDIISQHIKSTNVNDIPKYFKDDLIIYTLPHIDDKIFLCGNKTFEFKELIKNIPGRRWNQDFKCWEFPAKNLKLVQDLVDAKAPTSQRNAISPTSTDSVDPSLNIISVTSPPKRVKGSLGLFQMDNKLLLCGSKTYIFSNKLSQIGGGYFDRDLKCWVFPPSKAKELLAFIDYARQHAIIESQRIADQQANQKNIDDKNESDRLVRLQTHEYEAPFISNSRRNFYDNSVPHVEWLAKQNALDSQELEPMWRDKIVILHRQYVGAKIIATVTYNGDVKPPDLAMTLAVHNWWPHNWGTTIERVDYKQYKIVVQTD